MQSRLDTLALLAKVCTRQTSLERGVYSVDQMGGMSQLCKAFFGFFPFFFAKVKKEKTQVRAKLVMWSLS